MRNDFIRIVNWNVEWCVSDSRRADVLRERIWASNPDIVCLTEAHDSFIKAAGHVITSEPDYGYPIKAGRRKVVLWSKQPWLDVDRIGSPELPPGRFVQGQTQTSVGPVHLIGVCIPWAAAHVSTGRRDRNRWQDHVAYLQGLAPLIQNVSDTLVVLGDFNQKIPFSVAPPPVYEALKSSILNHLRTPTAGRLEPLDAQAIDHISHSDQLTSLAVRAISNIAPNGARLSDHFGIAVALTRTDCVPAMRRRLQRISM